MEEIKIREDKLSLFSFQIMQERLFSELRSQGLQV